MPRLHAPGLLYHVICRGNQKATVFLDDKDYRAYLFRIAQTHQIIPFRLYSYALMPNHVHLLIEAGESPLSKVMQVVQQRYTQYFNKKYNKIGHTFHGRYKAIICQKDAYLLELVRYIHLNPVRAQIVQTPEEYPWTSHNGYLARKADPWLDRDAILMQFGTETEQAKHQYSNFVMGSLKQGHRGDLYELKEQHLLGSDDFIDTLPLGAVIDRGAANQEKALLENLEKLVCEAFKVDSKELRKPNVRGLNIPRAALCMLARKRGISIPCVAASLGIKCGSLRQTMNRCREALPSHPAFARLASQSEQL